MKPIIITFCIVLSGCLHSQEEYEYYSYEKMADSLFDRNQYKEASFYYNKALKTKVPEEVKKTRRYRASCAFAMNENYYKAFKQLNHLTNRKSKFKYLFQLSGEDYINDSLFVNLHHKRRWKKHLKSADQKMSDIQKRLDSNLIRQIQLIGERDQFYRNQLFEVAEKFGYDSEEMKNLDLKITENDSINFKIVDSIIDYIGWPGKDIIGQENFNFFLVVQHMDINRQTKYLPLLIESVKEHKSLSGCQMMLEDRVSLRLTGYQLYGSQWCRDFETEEFYICPILEPNKIDDRRFKLYLMPMELEMKRSNYIWDSVEYERNLSKYVEIYQRDVID